MAVQSSPQLGVLSAAADPDRSSPQSSTEMSEPLPGHSTRHS